MKVKELIEILSKMDPEMEAVVASDSEGNYYHYVMAASQEYALKDMYTVEIIHPDDLESHKEIHPELVIEVALISP